MDDSGVSFNDLSTWNEYSVGDSGGDPWNAISMELLPWHLSWASDKQINLKMDNSIVNVDSAVGSADNFANINVDLLWYSNLNIRSDFYITGNLNQAGYSNLRVESGAKASVNTVGNFDSIVLDGDGTLLTSRTSSTFRDGFSSSNGASLSVLGNNYAYFEGSNSGSVFDSSTISGNIEVRNGGILHLKNSVFNAGSNNNPI